MSTTNVRPTDLNYHHYTGEKYDQDIQRSIPFYRRMHTVLARIIGTSFDKSKDYHILDLGTGTGITAARIRELLPNATLDLIDFSETMLRGAQKRLGAKKVRYIQSDYSTYKFQQQYDLVVCVIGFHHQTYEGMQNTFHKLYGAMKPGGMFLLGDLMTYANKRSAAYNTALHYHHLVQKAEDTRSLTEWAHHHMFLNNLATVEDLEKWLRNTGFRVNRAFLKWNTGLLIAKKTEK